MRPAKVLWGEGLFLRPQHFQQQDSYHESLSRDALLTAQPLGWGVRELRIDADALSRGIFRINRIDAVLPDGEPYIAPDRDLLPPPLQLDETRLGRDGTVLHLAVHHLREHGANAAASGDDSCATRYAIANGERNDLFTDAASADIAALRKQGQIRSASEPLEQFVTLPVARLRTNATNAFELDPLFMPPTVALRSSPVLLLRLQRLLDTLQAKAAALYGFHREPSKNVIEFRSGDIASFWLLHTVSSAYGALVHIHQNPALHPERLFQELLRLAGGLMTFSKILTLDDLPAYDHGNPGPSFARLEQILRDLLETVISTRYFSIALTEPRAGFHVGRLDSDNVDEQTALYLAVSAAQPLAELIESVPLRMKVGAPDDVDKLVLSAMSGVKLVHAAQVPPAIPVRPGACYFALDSRGPLYERMLKARSITIYAPNGYQDLKLELIAVMP
ncbi:type VI secretion system baseplate subunit TssK [Pseudothauera lacus]|uniref:Type VI secretion system baseplate subunit TssK n=1 Tax=Pseudothauera lacus TaxID=2136175 RepID=A0A2T4IEV2_9RHOO|nr:type VI secretion system baseplate subunit TssK [Pseudothauera lacus]PTD96291.1 type VI secretion system baseplate subunit TssK [Pseudothauera lacus]